LEETFKDCFVEFAVGTTGKETVEFYKQEEVNIFGGRGFTVAFADMMAFWKVNTLENVSLKKEWLCTIVW